MHTMGKILGSTAAIVLIAACAPAPPKEMAVRTDSAPVAEDFPDVGEIVEASWVEERMGASDGRIEAPGPSDLRLSAVVKLRREAVAKMISDLECTAGAPDVPNQLKGLLTPGVAWLSCDLPTTTKARTAFVVEGSEQAFLRSSTM
ncbi:hypothetical protein SAMN04489729_3027 [Amycolatopsis lurida]|uniref:Lipoprotein n=1 Tax=Amycolatopsis lurida NRRL 2430 TaxID=1460371 RepID=A0A2P2FS88_AMYLU|nr:hypothetical protein [Amycolatopsis lurida]KFU79588.1 hypothetical protein BB31_18925 [Amycolatopsis lurida NRRL 2430]SEC99368.1 hypothetical protein SAMN04489729_3027 [Amycolatopsis lurida]